MAKNRLSSFASSREPPINVGLLSTTSLAPQKEHLEKVLFLWWEEVDSNHRSRRRQIYSLMHLATLQSAQNIKLTDKSGICVVELVTGLEPATG